MLDEPRSNLVARIAAQVNEVYVRFAGLRDLKLEDPANQFVASAYRRSWIPLARARLDAGNLVGARAALERARAAYAAVEERTVTSPDRHWTGRVFLQMADLEERERGKAAGCRWLRQAPVSTRVTLSFLSR